VAVFELGSLICGVSVSSVMFIMGRAIAGCGAAGVLNGAFTIIAASAPLDKRPGMKTLFPLTDGFADFPPSAHGYSHRNCFSWNNIRASNWRWAHTTCELALVFVPLKPALDALFSRDLTLTKAFISTFLSVESLCLL
jgi:MFS family permease